MSRMTEDDINLLVMTGLIGVSALLLVAGFAAVVLA